MRWDPVAEVQDNLSVDELELLRLRFDGLIERLHESKRVGKNYLTMPERNVYVKARRVIKLVQSHPGHSRLPQ